MDVVEPLPGSGPTRVLGLEEGGFYGLGGDTGEAEALADEMENAKLIGLEHPTEHTNMAPSAEVWQQQTVVAPSPLATSFPLLRPALSVPEHSVSVCD